MKKSPEGAARRTLKELFENHLVMVPKFDNEKPGILEVLGDFKTMRMVFFNNPAQVVVIFLYSTEGSANDWSPYEAWVQQGKESYDILRRIDRWVKKAVCPGFLNPSAPTPMPVLKKAKAS